MVNDSYSISEAARRLGVSRPALYRYIEKRPGRYTVTDEKGKPRITFHGLGLLSEEMRTVQRTQSLQSETVTKSVTDVTNKPVTILSDDTISLQSSVTILQARLDAANAVIVAQRAQIITLEGALEFAQAQVPMRLTGHVNGIWARLFGRKGQNNKTTEGA